MWNLILKTWYKCTYLQNRNRLTDIEDKLVVTKGDTWQRGREKSGAWDKHTHTTIYKIDNQQGPTVEHRELNIL